MNKSANVNMIKRSPFCAQLYGFELLSQASEQVLQLAKQEGVHIALIGGFALQCLGGDRLTTDVDFVAERFLSGLPKGEEFIFGGWSTVAPNGVPADLIVRSDEFKPLFDEALSKSLQTDIVLPEYLIPMKMLAGRSRDMEDLVFLAAMSDMDRVKDIVKRHLGIYAVDQLHRLLLQECRRIEREMKEKYG